MRIIQFHQSPLFWLLLLISSHCTNCPRTLMPHLHNLYLCPLPATAPAPLSWLYADKLCKSTDNQAPRFNSQSLLLLLLLLRSRCCRISSQDTTEDEPLYKALLYVNRGDPRPVPVIYAARNKLNTFQSSHYHYNIIIIIIIMGWTDPIYRLCKSQKAILPIQTLLIVCCSMEIWWAPPRK